MHSLYEFLIYYCQEGLSLPKADLLQWTLSQLPVKNAISGIWESVDRMGNETRPIQEGRCYLGEPLAHIVITGLLTTDTIEVPAYSDTPTCTVNDYLVIANTEKVGAVTIKRAGEIIGFFKCDEQDGTVCYNSNKSHASALPDGTITGATLLNWHAKDNSFYSYQNNFGYALKTGVDGLIPLDSNYQSVVSDPDTLYQGRVKYNAQILNSSVANFDGVDDSVVASSVNAFSGNNNLTVFAKFKTKSSFHSGFTGIIGDWNTSSKRSFLLAKNATDAKIKFYVSSNGIETPSITSDSVMLTDSIYHVVGRVTNGLMEMFINGVKQIGTETVASIYNFANLFQICSFDDSYNNNIFMYESGVYTDSKSDEEIATLTNKGFVIANLDNLDRGYNFSECSGAIVYDKSGNDNHGTITNATLSTFWSNDATGKVKPSNLSDGFDLWTLDSDPTKILRVPFDVNGDSIKTRGDTITGYTWQSRNIAGNYHNNSENTIKEYVAPALISSDVTRGYLYSSEVPQEIAYSDLKGDVDSEHKIFCNIATDNERKDFLVYSSAQTGAQLNIIRRYNNINLWVDSKIWKDSETWTD